VLGGLPKVVLLDYRGMLFRQCRRFLYWRDLGPGDWRMTGGSIISQWEGETSVVVVVVPARRWMSFAVDLLV
jgi:hypothetical protein